MPHLPLQPVKEHLRQLGSKFKLACDVIECDHDIERAIRVVALCLGLYGLAPWVIILYFIPLESASWLAIQYGYSRLYSGRAMD